MEEEEDDGWDGYEAAENLAKSDNHSDIPGSEARSKVKRGYLSPILLSGNCGQAISPGDLSPDEK